MKTTVQVQQRGTVTLPAELRQKYNIRTGDIFSLLDLDGVFVLASREARVPKLAREIEQMRLEADLSSKELLIALREERERYYEETFNEEK